MLRRSTPARRARRAASAASRRACRARMALILPSRPSRISCRAASFCSIRARSASISALTSRACSRRSAIVASMALHLGGELLESLLLETVLLADEAEEGDLGLGVREAARVEQHLEPPVLAHLVHLGDAPAEELLLPLQGRLRARELQARLGELGVDRVEAHARGVVAFGEHLEVIVEAADLSADLGGRAGELGQARRRLADDQHLHRGRRRRRRRRWQEGGGRDQDERGRRHGDSADPAGHGSAFVVS